MDYIKLSKKDIADLFSTSLIGRLSKGMVHNFNGPLQIISMQLEMAKNDLNKAKALVSPTESEDISSSDSFHKLSELLSKQDERISQLLNTVSRIEQLAQIIGKRGNVTQSSMKKPVHIPTLIEEELLFWQSDLFFKHQVERHFDEQTVSRLVTTDELMLRDLVDCLLGYSIERLKEAEQKKLFISVKEDGDVIRLDLSHTGEPFPQDEPVEITEPASFLNITLLTAKVRASDIGAKLQYESNKATVLIPC